MSGKPDLTLHTLSHFLDRFVYRTPKTATSTRGASIMQPLAGGDTQDRLVEAGKAAPQGMPLNSENFWKRKADEVAAEDVFFHEYFNRVNKDKTRAKKGKDDDEDPVARDEEGDELSDAESEIWKALVDSRPEVEAGDSDDDLDLDDLDSAYDDDEDEDAGAGEGDDDEVIFNDESDEPSDEEFDGLDEDEDAAVSSPPAVSKKAPAKTGKDAKTPAKDDESDDFDMDVSDDEAFLDSDEDLPSDMELGGVELPAETPDVPTASDSKKRRKLKHLPTFASADDYAALLADEDEGM